MEKLIDIFAVVNNKGGVAKTTTCQNLAAAMLRKNKKLKILLVDLDPQGNLSMLLGWNPEQNNGRTVYDSLLSASSLPVYKSESGLYYVPSSPLLQHVDVALYQQMNSKTVLTKCFGKEPDNQTEDKFSAFDEFFDYIIIDCPPALGEVTYNAMALASRIIVPCTLEGLSAAGITNILAVAENVKQINPDIISTTLLPVIVDKHPNVSRDFLDFFKKNYDIYKTTIRRCIKITEAQMRLKDIFQYSPYCSTAIDYEDLAEEIFNNKTA